MRSLKNKKTMTVISVMFLLSFMFIFSNTVIVKADDITDMIVEVGVVNAIITFTVPNSGDSVYIKFDTDSDPTDGIQTYTDPDDLLNGVYYGSSGTTRYMLLRGLNESTMYYYAIYLNGVKDTSSPYPSFTTSSRFTNNTGWGDEFLDDYLVDAHSDITFNQNQLKKSGDIISSDTIVKSAVTVLNKNNAFQLFTGKTSNGVHFNSSETGLSFSNFQNTGVTASEFMVCWDESNDRYVLVKQYTEGGAGNYQDYHIGNTTFGNELSWGTITKIYSQSPTVYEPPTIAFDSLGSNSFIVSNINHAFYNGIRRYGALFNIIDYEKWIMIQGSKQHRDYNMGIGLVNEQFTGSDSFYGMSITIRNGIYIGLAHVLENDQTSGGRMSCFLTYSRNGYDWYTFIENPTYDNTDLFIPIGSSGEWDDGIIRPDNNVLHTVNDIDRIYFTGKDTPHGSSGTVQLSYGTVRTQGLTYINPSSSDAWLRTNAIDSDFVYNFTVNFNGTETSGLNIAVLNPNTNQPYSSFSFADFDTITTNSITHSPTWGSRTLSNIPDGDFKLNFSWTGVGSGELYSYEIDSEEREDSFGFQSINNQANNTITYDIITDFNWTKTDGASYYQLQIANDSGFTDVFVNLTDVNATNYPGNYTETGGYVEFTLPEAYRRQWYQGYYFRIRSFSYYTGG